VTDSPERGCDCCAGLSGVALPPGNTQRQLLMACQMSHPEEAAAEDDITAHSTDSQQRTAPLFSTYGSVPPLRWRIQACGSSGFARYFAGKTGAGGLHEGSRASVNRAICGKHGTCICCSIVPDLQWQPWQPPSQLTACQMPRL
jgi:hypothetical protein